MRRTTILIPLIAVAVVYAASGCSSSSPTAAPNLAATTASSLPTPVPTGPTNGECASFADVYNSQISSILTNGNGGGDLGWTKEADAFEALGQTLTGFSDPYSQTMATDVSALVASDQAYDADGNGLALIDRFTTDLTPFLVQCGMQGNTQ